MLRKVTKFEKVQLLPLCQLATHGIVLRTFLKRILPHTMPFTPYHAIVKVKIHALLFKANAVHYSKKQRYCFLMLKSTQLILTMHSSLNRENLLTLK